MRRTETEHASIRSKISQTYRSEHWSTNTAFTVNANQSPVKFVKNNQKVALLWVTTRWFFRQISLR